MPTAQKAAAIDALADRFQRAQLVVVANYRGLSVSQMQQLRGTLRETNAEFTVAKNTLTRLASERAGVEIPAEHLEGPTALMFAYEDVVAPAKALSDFVRTSRVLELKTGVMEGHTLSTGDIEALASMPPREELLARLVGLLASPMSRAVGALSGPSRSLLNALNAQTEQVANRPAAKESRNIENRPSFFPRIQLDQDPGELIETASSSSSDIVAFLLDLDSLGTSEKDRGYSLGEMTVQIRRWLEGFNRYFVPRNTTHHVEPKQSLWGAAAQQRAKPSLVALGSMDTVPVMVRQTLVHGGAVLIDKSRMGTSDTESLDEDLAMMILGEHRLKLVGNARAYRAEVTDYYGDEEPLRVS
jgi:large subunit ribosomal protein L10